ncbi:beta/gamma crystallin domain-containing protein 3-like [Xyrauchen texanus]|uniref:beta/gamma crystallin domain-containing protein 3-like n=1 Tax=Xyrauchen texanus TaxID=154827 RepID=UPI0022419DFF|nr:beta/gamma crystallin domain-containing protein 3-like [Xyrauchen texanus]
MMSDPKSSWHEDFARNFSRFFSRSKSVDTHESEADGSTFTCSAHKDSFHTPELQLNMPETAAAQELQLSDGADRNSVSPKEVDTQGDSLEPPAPPPTATAPPADGFFRRLSSLFHFGRAEPSGVQRETHTDSESSSPNTGHRDSATQQTDSSVELSHQTSEDLSVCHSDFTHKQYEEHSEELREYSLAECLEDKRCFDLACQPVVTIGTYRGQTEFKRAKKKHHLELHSPSSEREEVTHPDSHDDTVISSALNTMSSDSQDNSITVSLVSYNPSWKQQVENNLIQSALWTDTETTDRGPTVESGATPTSKLNHIVETGSDQLITCIETDSAHTVPKVEPRLLNEASNSGQEELAQSETPETVSVNCMPKETHLFCNNALMHHHSPHPAPEQRLKQKTSSVFTDRKERLCPDDSQMNCREEERLTEEDSRLDEEVLRLESKKMVDGILKNALAAFQMKDVSEVECDTLSTCDLHKGSISCQLEEHDENQAVPEYSAEEKEVDATLFCKSSGRNADDEPLSPNVHSNRDVFHKKDISVVLPAVCESLIGEEKEQHAINISEYETEQYRVENRCQDSAKDNKKSNNCRHNLDTDSCDASSITPDIDSLVNQESQTQSLSVSGKCDPFIPSPESDTKDPAIRETPKTDFAQQPTATQSYTATLYSGGADQDQVCCDSVTGEDQSFPACVTDVQTHSRGLGPSQWMSVKAISCEVTDDQRQSPVTLNLDQADGRISAVSPSGRTLHLDLPDSSSRGAASVPQHPQLDLHQVDGGFAIISEEEEIDAVFVNDTGPVHSPGTRRAKAYPFSLSPIYEEESGHEEVSETLQVLPLTEEEQRSVEQPASSILSLLQSVSEKLQSSVVCVSDEDQAESLRATTIPLWHCYRDGSEEDDDGDDNNFRVLVHQQLTEAKPVQKPNTEDELSSNIDQTAKGAHERIQEELEYNSTQVNAGKNINAPFYQYLKSRVTTSADKEPKDTKHIVCCNETNTTVMGEIEGFGRVIPRPSIMLIYEGQSISGDRREICDDVEDTNRVLFPCGATIHVLRGCWLLYVDLCFHGSCVLLEEGQTMRTRRHPQQNLQQHRDPRRTDISDVLSVCSIRTLLKDNGVPEIHIHSSMCRTGQTIRLFSATDLTEQHDPVTLSDLFVKTGCWLVYEESGFSGNSAVLETDGRVTPVLHSSLVSCVKSLRPLKMGGLKVARPLDPKVMLFGKTQFQGECRELLNHTDSLKDTEGSMGVSSLRVTGGIWVGFSSEGFRGHQCVLEEGGYSDCSRLFKSSIKSLRYIHSDFLEASICLKSSDEEVTVVDQEVADLQRIGITQDTNNIYVKSGAWVAYSDRCFTGDQYVLERGRHSGTLEWGDRRSSPRSLRPIRREVCTIIEPISLLRIYSQTHYNGESREFVSEAPDCGGLRLQSFRVIRGSWLLFDEEGFSGNQYILGEGLYPDLTSCGCASAVIKSVKPVPYSFTDPSVSLFSLSGFEGLEETSHSDVENISHFFSQSVRVNSGLWVAYEYSHFKGRQMLLQPREYPDWGGHSGWETVGSLRPLKQPCVHIQIRNRALGSVLTAESVPIHSFPANVFLSSADRSLDTQRWIFTDGLLKNTVTRGCLSVIGAKACAGARVALWEEHGHVNQRWSLNEDGTFSSHLNRSLVLDIKGGVTADTDHLILSPLCVDTNTQNWDVDVL